MGFRWSWCHTGLNIRALSFLYFVNDLPTVVDHAQINMYADDTVLHCCGEDLQCVQNDLQSDLYRVQGWLQANRLQLNILKSVLRILAEVTES